MNEQAIIRGRYDGTVLGRTLRGLRFAFNAYVARKDTAGARDCARSALDAYATAGCRPDQQWVTCYQITSDPAVTGCR